MGRRVFGAVGRFCLAVLIGVGATLAWQAYGDDAKAMLTTAVPSLGSFLSVSTMKPSAGGQMSAQDAALAPSGAVAQGAASATPPIPPALAQQLATMTGDLAAVRHSLDEFAAKQDQMAQTIATLQAAEQDISQKLSPAPAVPLPPHRHPKTAHASTVPASSVPPPASAQSSSMPSASPPPPQSLSPVH